MKKLYRYETPDAKLGGVCLGLAKHYNQDVILVRAIFLILFFTPFPAFIIYLIFWGMLPVQYSTVPNALTYQEPSNSLIMNQSTKQNNLLGGLILIVLGIIFSFRTFFDINLFHYIGKLWPLILIGIGVWMIVRERPLDDNTNQNRFDDNTNPPTY